MLPRKRANYNNAFNGVTFHVWTPLNQPIKQCIHCKLDYRDIKTQPHCTRPLPIQPILTSQAVEIADYVDALLQLKLLHLQSGLRRRRERRID